MKTTKLLLLLIFGLIVSLDLMGQDNDSPTQTICFGSIKPYRVDWRAPDGLNGTPGSSYNWTLSPAVSPTASITAGNGTNNITIDWGTTAPGTYIDAVTVVETNNGCPGTPIKLTVNILAIPDVPTVITNPATCSAEGTATISNYSGLLTYTFSPTGPSVGASGVISGLTAGTSYSVTASNGTCTSAPSASFSIATQLTTPADPEVDITPATCSAEGTATISNYSGLLTYTFSPTGPSVGTSGVISGLTAGATYTVTASNGPCTSAPSALFSIATQLTTPADPEVDITPATCSADGIATISNYSVSLTYTFIPTGPSVGTSGVISGLTVGTSYTVTAGNGSCTSAPSASFNIAAQLTTPVVPEVGTNPATCSADGIATISNYSVSLTYTFIPTGPSVGTSGVISGLTAGTSYTVTAGNGSCTSAASSSFNVAAQLLTPTITLTSGPTCSLDLLTYGAVITVSSGTPVASSGSLINTSGNIWTLSGVTVGVDVTITLTVTGCQDQEVITTPICNCDPITAPEVINTSYCAGSGIPQFNVTNLPPSGFTLNWYSVASGGSIIGTGTPFTPGAPGTYYAQFVEDATSCTSQRTAVTVTEKPLPTTSPIFHD
jgi:membrane associated rhomboid family serine protease